MIFEQKLLKFSSLSLIYGLYEQVAIWDAMGGTLFHFYKLFVKGVSILQSSPFGSVHVLQQGIIKQMLMKYFR